MICTIFTSRVLDNVIAEICEWSLQRESRASQADSVEISMNDTA